MKQSFLLLLLLLTLLLSFNISSQVTINLDKTNGVYTVPCKVNGIPMDFIFDTGASNVTISLTEATFLIKQGLLDKKDIKESVKYQIANGDVNEGTNIILREIDVAGLKIKNIKATIVHEQNAPLLLGMSALNQLGKIEIENNKLIINDFSFKGNKNSIDFDKEIIGTIDWINSVLIKHQYETKDTRQIASFDEIKEIKGEFVLIGKRIQETTNPWGFSQVFVIPLLKINNIAINEKQNNYWMTIKIKNAEEAILLTKDGESWESKDKIDFMINKSIDNESLRPKLINAIEYLIELHKDKSTTNDTAVLSTHTNKEIRIKYQDGIEIFNVYQGKDQPIYKENKKYYWHTKLSKIKSTKGGNGGNLLNGNYKFFDEEGNLIIEENYAMGLKHGESKFWNKNGELTDIYRHDNGESVYWKHRPPSEEGWIEHTGTILADGWIKKSYNENNELEAMEEYFIDRSCIIEKLKRKITNYYPKTGKLKYIYFKYLAKDERVGEYKAYHENGQLELSGNFYDTFKHGIDNYIGEIRDGKWQWYFENGNLDQEDEYRVSLGYYKSGSLSRLNGEIYNKENDSWAQWGLGYVFWEENGNKKNERNSYYGLDEGINKEWHENGQLSVETYSKNGIYDGTYKLWYKNGRLRYTVNYINGKSEGISKDWYENGQLSEEKYYKNGIYDGAYKSWYKNGQLIRTINYINGKREGILKEWYENGQLSLVINYKNDLKEGIEKYWHKNGQLELEGNNINNKREGVFKEWYENGQLLVVQTFINHKTEGAYKEWHENGQLKSEYNYINDKIEGVVKWWHENGQLNSECNFINDKKEGIQKWWHANGQLNSECNYINDKIEGVVKWWHENGQLNSECNYINGKREGAYKEWHENGQLKETTKWVNGEEVKN